MNENVNFLFIHQRFNSAMLRKLFFPDLPLKAAGALLDQQENSPNESRASAQRCSQKVFLFSSPAAAAPLETSGGVKGSTVSFFPVYKRKASVFN